MNTTILSLFFIGYYSQAWTHDFYDKINSKQQNKAILFMIWRLQIKIQEQKNELYIRIKYMNQNTKANDVKMSNRINKQILRKEVE